MTHAFPMPIAEDIWNLKYRLKDPMTGDPIDMTVEDTWSRTANALAAAETNQQLWQGNFYAALEDWTYMPAGRIIAGASTERNVTLFNCFVMGTVPDDLKGIFDALSEAARTMQQGGGIGYDFSTLRPKGALVKRVGAKASGPLPFMDTWDAMCRTIMSAGTRRGAMMATMRCDHPDILSFITAKQDPARLRMFNVSVLCTDRFMDAVKRDKQWDLVFDGKVYETVSALELWRQIMRSTYDYAEPGVIFIDRINEANNLRYCETIAATNPCFAGDEKILTADGPKTFFELEGKRIPVLTENQAGKLVYRPMDVFKTATDQELLLVTLDDGTKIKCTHTHEFFDLDRNRIEARALVPGQRLASVYRHNANSKGYKRLTNGTDNPLEHHVPFEIIPEGFHVPHKNKIKEDNRPNHKVVSIEPLVGRQDVFCGTVEETHKFFLACDRGGVLVSNCGEQPLPPYGACLLGSVNLAKLVKNAFYDSAQIDGTKLAQVVSTAVRMMDNVNDVSKFPLEAQRVEAQNKRRIGLGVTGLADALAMMGIRYGSDEAVAKTGAIMSDIATEAYKTSIALAAEKGSFPLYDYDHFTAEGTFAAMMAQDPEIDEGLRNYGIRNALLLSIAPTGTISMYGGNVSSGIEPMFAYEYERKVTRPDGTKTTEDVKGYAVHLYHEKFPGESLPDYFVTAQDLTPQDHVAMQAVCQRWIDSSISKTINLPEDISFADFEQVYMDAYAAGCKGCTTYRPNDVTGSVLSVKKVEKPADVVPSTELAERPDVLEGSTYKVKMGGDPAFYVTITDILEDDLRRPFEVFINTKNPEHIAWSSALTRMVSAIFRRPHDSSFVVEELKNVFDPKGGGWWKSKYRPSVVAAIGQVIEDHMVYIGYLDAPETAPQVSATPVAGKPSGPLCPQCQGANYKHEGGCTSCGDCGHSSCG